MVMPVCLSKKQDLFSTSHWGYCLFVLKLMHLNIINGPICVKKLGSPVLMLQLFLVLAWGCL
jgi:hypothetical protein